MPFSSLRRWSPGRETVGRCVGVFCEALVHWSTFLRRRLRIHVLWILTLFGCLGGGIADDGKATKSTPKAEAPPEIRELWVPAENLESVLKKYPRAVMLTPDQYARLLRDSLPTEDEKNASEEERVPPVASVLGKVDMVGELHEDVVAVRATYEAEIFVEDQWTEIPLVLPRQQLARLSVDGKGVGAVGEYESKPEAKQLGLLVRGAGRHQLIAEFHLPIERDANGKTIRLPSPTVAAAQLELEVREGIELDSELPFSLNGNKAHFVLPAKEGEYEIRWAAGNIAPIDDAAIFQTCRYLYSIDTARVQGDLGLVLSSNLRDLPLSFAIDLPNEVRLLSVEGSELLRWDREENGDVRVDLVEGSRRAADLRFLVEAPVELGTDADSAAATIALPSVAVQGVHRASGTLALIGSEDVKVQSVETGPLTVPARDELEAAIRDHPNFVSGFRFPVLSGAPTVTLSAVAQRFNAQLDTAITMKRDAIHLRRELLVVPLEGRLFATRIDLPAGEEISSLSWKDGELFGRPQWDRAGDTGDGSVGLRIEWPGGLIAGEGRTVVIDTRRDPEDWFALGEEPTELSFSSAGIPDAEAVSGYVAVAFDDSFRVETSAAEGLEARDARAAPVKGQLAWFRLRDYSLQLDAARRPSEFDAEVTAYLLPLQSTLEVEGQLDLNIRYTPLAELVVQVAPEVAEYLRFESPLIAEKKLDEESGQWTLTFHQEPIGDQRLRFHMSVPYGDDDGEASENGEAASDDARERRFATDVPVLSVEGVQRISGQWLVEANTDTELSFEAQGMDEIDLLRASLIEGYSPRHRVIAAYEFRGDDHRLSLSGVRHEAAELVTAVVDELKIDSVLSTDGLDRHQAKIQLRTVGEQFLEVGLPKGAQLWTLTVDGEAVKPVTSSAGALRIALPSNADGRAEVEIKLVYQLRHDDGGWGGSGRRELEPVRLSQKLPVLHSAWRLHLPEGYDYQKFRSNLRQRFEVVDRTLLGQAARSWGRPSAGAVAGAREALVAVPAGEEPLADSDIAEAASRYVIRMQERVKQADQAALRGNAQMGDGDYEESLANFREALVLLPDATMTKERRQSFVAQYAAATVALARERAEEGDYGEAISLLDSVLADDVDPDHASAKRLRAEIMDPEIYPAAMTPELRERLRTVERALKDAQGAVDLGDFDAAEKYYNEALANDPYNEAARRGLEKVERQKIEYYQTARDHTRARFIREIEAGWEVPMPAELRETEAEALTLMTDGAQGVAAVEEKLKSIIIPSVEFVDTPLRDALEFLTQKSAEMDVHQPDPTKKGINFILSTGAGAAPPAPAQAPAPAGGGFGTGVGETPITLKLTNVPLIEAIRYTTSLAQLKFDVEPHAIVIKPLSTPDSDLYTNVYRVPPTFLNSAAGSGGAAAGPVDPFAAPSGAGGGGLASRVTAREILEQAGLTFGEGATAMYDPSSGQLIVRNTQDQMELVEAFVEPLGPGDPDSMPKMKTMATPSGDDLTAGDLSAFRELFGTNGERDFKASVNKQEVVESADQLAIALVEEKLKSIILPSVEFEETPLHVALDFLSSKSAELDAMTEGPAEKGIRFSVGSVGADTPITLRLSNVPLIEAVRYTASLAQLKFKIEPGRVVVLPLSAPGAELQTLVVEVPPNALSNGLDSPPSTARDLLERAGVIFPEGAGAAYNPATQRLAVKNTADQLELVEAYFGSMNYVIDRGRTAAGLGGGRLMSRADGQAVVGLIPIDFELPEAGRVYRFEGLYAPESLRFRYVDWERQVRLAWWWILFGALAFAFVAVRWGRPWFFGFLGVVVLAFLPLSLMPTLMAVCNALLIGWGTSMALLVIWKVANAARRWQQREAMRARAAMNGEAQATRGEVVS